MKRFVLLAVLATMAGAAAAQQECRIEFQRADNALSAPGRPDGQLGTETLTLKPGQTKVFNTDWKFEKRRNDGSNYYGSHVRILRNTGPLAVNLELKGNEGGVTGLLGAQVVGQRAVGGLGAGQSANQLRHDLEQVRCASAGTTAGPTPSIAPPAGLSAQQVTPDTIALTWQPVPNAREYRVYVDPPPQPSMAGKPSAVGGTGRQFIISTRNVAPGTMFRATIETVAQDGSVSPRGIFPNIAVQTAGGPATGGGATTGGGSTTGGGATSSGPSSSPSTTSGSDQQCPAGQFVTGISSTGKIICGK